jgi:hypothetical protein
MSTRPSFSPRLLAIVILTICTTSALAIPPRNKVINRLSRTDEPVTIVSAKVNGKAIDFGKAFAERNNWLGGLTFVIKNTSTKTISWARVALSFSKPEPAGELNDFMTYGIGRWDIDKIRGGGPPLKPGETAEVSYSWEQYQSVREILDGMGYPPNIRKIKVSVDQIIFADQPELMWIEGKMNEFHSPNGWKPIVP